MPRPTSGRRRGRRKAARRLRRDPRVVPAEHRRDRLGDLGRHGREALPLNAMLVRRISTSSRCTTSSVRARWRSSPVLYEGSAASGASSSSAAMAAITSVGDGAVAVEQGRDAVRRQSGRMLRDPLLPRALGRREAPSAADRDALGGAPCAGGRAAPAPGRRGARPRRGTWSTCRRRGSARWHPRRRSARRRSGTRARRSPGRCCRGRAAAERPRSGRRSETAPRRPTGSTCRTRSMK